MTVRSRLLLPASALVLAFAFAAPAAFADDMSKDSMSKGTTTKMSAPKGNDHMPQTPDKSAGTGMMKKDGMSDPKSSGTMSK